MTAARAAARVAAARAVAARAAVARVAAAWAVAARVAAVPARVERAAAVPAEVDRKVVSGGCPHVRWCASTNLKSGARAHERGWRCRRARDRGCA